MIPVMGFCQLTLFGGYAIYFPELFPTRLRSTGTSFCYNVGRYVAALGPLTMGQLINTCLRPPRPDQGLALHRRDDEPVLPDRPARPALRSGNQRQAAAGVNRGEANRRKRRQRRDRSELLRFVSSVVFCSISLLPLLMDGSSDSDFGVPIPGRVLPPEQWARTAIKRLPPPGLLDWQVIFGRERRSSSTSAAATGGS